MKLSSLAVAGLIAFSVSCSGSNGSRKDARGEHGSQEAVTDTVALTARVTSLIKECMNGADSITAHKSISKFIGDIHRNRAMLEITDSLADLYLYNPMSPVRNDDLYIMFLREMLTADSLPDHLRERDEELLKLVAINRPGMMANDFKFIDRDGVTTNLKSLFTPQEKSGLLLIFYDPECAHCSEILKSVASNEKINRDIAAGRVRVLAVYAEGNRKVWDSTKAEMPANWRVAFDLSDIVDNDLYDLPAMPSIYLLDSTGRVELKDPTIY